MTMVRHLLESGALIAAGPIQENTSIRGVLIFSTNSVGEGRRLVADDPAIVEGHMLLDLYTWFGPIGLGVRTLVPDPTQLDFQTD